MEHRTIAPGDRRIAYFSMEIGLTESIPTYSGGLGILAGDTLKAAADLGVPILGITLLAEKGYFTQELDPKTGEQRERPTEWDVKGQLKLLKPKVDVQIEGRDVNIRVWQYDIVGCTGFTVPILYLDTNLPENDPKDRELTWYLYGGDQAYRIAQEIVLGIGGVRILRELGYEGLNRYHMNEGHAAFLALELFREDALRSSCPIDDYDACLAGSMNDIRKYCVFTTHTPVAAGHDQFDYGLAQRMLGDLIPIDLLKKLGGDDKLNMTLLALNLSHYVNSVAKQHQHVSAHLFPGYQFSSITNGVHSTTWTSEPFCQLFDRHMPTWRQDSYELRYALRVPENEIWDAHEQSKASLVKLVNERYSANFRQDAFTIGFARRVTAYKRIDLLFRDIPRLRAIGERWPLQLVFAGKSHPADTMGKDLIKKVFWHMGEIRDKINVVFVPDYGMELAKVVIPGVDLWLNTPARPKEASGTSGMKAAHNAVPQLSVLDGWWVEGHLDSITGWSIGPMPTEVNENVNDDYADAEELYKKLENVILPMYYEHRPKWLHVMRNAIAFNASFFNTHRMMQQYVLNAYLL